MFFLLLPVISWSQDQRTCIKSFRITGTNNYGSSEEVIIKTTRRFYDFSPAALQKQNNDDRDLYKGYDYIKIGEPSQQQDCAGYVFDKLWGVGRVVVGGSEFQRTVLNKFAKKISDQRWGSVKAGDIVAYVSSDGIANHITIVREVVKTLGFTTSVKIETKDGNQGLFLHDLSRLPASWSNDPLVRNWGTPTFYRVDPANIRVTELNNGPCDENGDMKLVLVQVFDAQTNLPISGASVRINDYSGTAVSSAGVTNMSGESNITIPVNQINNSLRVTASATGYEERWSDIPAGRMQPVRETMVYPVYLIKKTTDVTSDEIKKYGPFTIIPGKWTSTGLRLKKGKGVSVTASGTWKYTEGTMAEFGPGGGGYWRWWVLKAKVGDEMFDVGRDGMAIFSGGGNLELGAPATNKMGNPEEKTLSGAYIAYIFVNVKNLE